MAGREGVAAARCGCRHGAVDGPLSGCTWCSGVAQFGRAGVCECGAARPCVVHARRAKCSALLRARNPLPIFALTCQGLRCQVPLGRRSQVRCERTVRFSLRIPSFIASTSRSALRCGTHDQHPGSVPVATGSVVSWSSAQSTIRLDEAMSPSPRGRRAVASPVLSPSLLRTHARRACDPARAVRCALRSEETLSTRSSLVWSRRPARGPSVLAGRGGRPMGASPSTAHESRTAESTPSARALSGPCGT